MARALNPQDAYAFINSLAGQMQGTTSLTATDGSSFIAVGETLLQAGMENVLNALGLVLGRTFMASRPYDAKFKILNAVNSGLYAGRMRKISFYSKPTKPAGFENTQLNPENLLNGVDNTGSSSSGHERAPSMWEQNPAVPLQVDFSGSTVWQASNTIYEVQLQKAFRSESEFNAFIGGILTELGNDIEQQKESMARATLLNFITGIYDMGSGSGDRVVNLTALYNSTFSTSYTTAQLLSTYIESFSKFMVEQLMLTSDRMTHRTDAYHWAPTKSGYALLRHTPKSEQKLFLYNPLMTKIREYVYPSLFGPGYLDINNYEGVDYWQSFDTPQEINFKPAVIDTSTGAQKAATAAVNLKYVVGVLFDTDALMVDTQLDAAYSTPLESRKLFRNLWYSFRYNYCCDYTENGVIFIMADPS